MSAFIVSSMARPEMAVCGWALLHFVWQGIVIAAALALGLSFMGSRQASLRYAFCMIAMLAMPICLIATLWLLHGERKASITDLSFAGDFVHTKVFPPAPMARPSATSSIVGVHEANREVDPELNLNACMPLVAAAWLIGVTVFALRKIGGFYIVWRLRRISIELPGEALMKQFHRACAKLGTAPSHVSLRVSRLVSVPVTMGWLRPLILVPSSLVSGVGPDDIKYLIAHELAHIRRHDYLFNIVQAVVETIFFYHPATWWISRRIRQEREHACDDLVATSPAETLAYSRALLLLESDRAWRCWLVTGADGGHLLRRIERLAGRPSNVAMAFPLIFGAAGLSLALVVAGILEAESPAFPGKSTRAKAVVQILGSTDDRKASDPGRQNSTFINETTDQPIEQEANATTTTGAPSPTPVAPHFKSERERILSKLHSIVVDRINFENPALSDVIQVLTEKSVKFDSQHKGINFVLNLETSSPPITIHLANVSLYDVLVSIVKQSRLAFSIDDGAVYIRPPPKLPNSELPIRTYLAPPNFFTSAEFSGLPANPAVNRGATNDPLDHDVKDELASRGILFSPGATAMLLGSSAKLLVCDTPDEEDRIERMIEDSLENRPNITSSGKKALAPTLTEAQWPIANRLALRVIAISEADYQSHRVQFDADLAKGDITKLGKLRSFSLLSEPTVLVKSGKSVTMEDIRVFPVPVAFERVGGKLGPTNFERKNIGVSFNASSEFKGGVIQVTGKLSITSFQGWTRTGESTVSPTFRTCESYLYEEIKDGQTKGICVPGLQFDRGDGNIDFRTGVPETSVKQPPSRILLFLTASRIPWAYDKASPPVTAQANTEASSVDTPARPRSRTR